MRHPVVSKQRLDIRKGIGDLLKSSCELIRDNSVIFVCGGGDDSARSRFILRARTELPAYDFLRPEDAMLRSWDSSFGPFNIVEFEKLIAELSMAVVLFPEAAGSFCETGYFVAREEILSKLLLAIDQQYADSDSFISTGPLHYVNEKSHFRPAIYTDYKGDFKSVISRIQLRAPYSNFSQIPSEQFKNLKPSIKIGVVHFIIKMLRMSSFEDLIYVLKSVYIRVKENEIRSFVLMLIAMGYVKKVDSYQYFVPINGRPDFIRVRAGHKKRETELSIEIASALSESAEFFAFMESINDN